MRTEPKIKIINVGDLRVWMRKFSCVFQKNLRMFTDLTFIISFNDCKGKSIANLILFLQVNNFLLVKPWFLLDGDLSSNYTNQSLNFGKIR